MDRFGISLAFVVFAMTSPYSRSNDDFPSQKIIAKSVPANTNIFVYADDFPALIKQSQKLVPDTFFELRPSNHQFNRLQSRFRLSTLKPQPVELLLQLLTATDSTRQHPFSDLIEGVDRMAPSELKATLCERLSELFEGSAFLTYELSTDNRVVNFGFQYNSDRFDWWRYFVEETTAKRVDELSRTTGHDVIWLPVEKVFLLRRDNQLIGTSASLEKDAKDFFLRALGHSAFESVTTLHDRREYQRLVQHLAADAESTDLFYYQYHASHFRDLRDQQLKQRERNRTAVTPLEEQSEEPTQALNLSFDADDAFFLSSISSSCGLTLDVRDDDSTAYFRFVTPLAYPYHPLVKEQFQYLRALPPDQERFVSSGSDSVSFFHLNSAAHSDGRSSHRNFSGSGIHALWSYLPLAHRSRRQQTPYQSGYFSPLQLAECFPDSELAVSWIAVQGLEGRSLAALPVLHVRGNVETKEIEKRLVSLGKDSHRDVSPKRNRSTERSFAAFEAWDFLDKSNSSMWSTNQFDEAQLLIGESNGWLAVLPYCRPSFDVTGGDVPALVSAYEPTTFTLQDVFDRDLSELGEILAISYDRRPGSWETFYPVYAGITEVSKSWLENSAGECQWLQPSSGKETYTILGELTTAVAAQVWLQPNAREVSESAVIMVTVLDQRDRFHEIHAIFGADDPNGPLAFPTKAKRHGSEE